MLIQLNPCLRGDVLCVSSLRRNRRLSAVRSCIGSSSTLSAQAVTRKPLDLGLGSTTMSFKIEEKSSRKLVVEEQNGDLPGSTSYEKAMEALSSLITHQKHGDKSNIGGKYGKLERMEMYLQDKVTEDLPMPPLFQFLTIMAFKIFVSEQVDVAITEVGLGGRQDSTNVIKQPVVCGIASLGMDHMEALGDTLESIVSHQAGILKPNTPAFTVPQLPEAMAVLEEVACDLMVPLETVPPISYKKLNGTKLSLAGDHQYVNAALAVVLCKSWLQHTHTWDKLLSNDASEEDLPDAFLRGLSSARLSGRAQVVHDMDSKSNIYGGDLIFYMDGAHTPESMDVCARWFSSAVKENDDLASPSSVSSSLENGYVHGKKENIIDSSKITKRILLFNCMEVRSPHLLLPQLVGTCASSGVHFSKALFVPSISTYNKVTSGASIATLNGYKDLSWQFGMQRTWEKIIHGKDSAFDKDIRTEFLENSPTQGFNYDDYSHCNLGEGHHACSLVIPSLPQAIKWIRDFVKENPSFKVQVLVTGSLHLVGDVLKLLRK